MDSQDLTKIAGAVLSALLVIFGFKTLIDVRMAGQASHGSGVGYTLPLPSAAAPAAKPAGEAKAADAKAGEAKPADAKAAEAKPADTKAPAAKPAEGAAAPAPAAAPAAAGAGDFDAKKVVSMVAGANAEAGAATFKKCAACHSASASEPSKAGPNLWNIVGRNKGTREDFKSYSEAMKTKGGAWTYEDLAQFVHNPKGFVAGTKMIFPGVKEPSDVADLLAHLRTLGDKPADLPK